MNLRTLAAASLALVTAACSAQYSSVFLADICAPPAPDSTTGACTYAATCEAVLASRPRLDVSTATLDFRLPLEIDNSLADNASSDAGTTNTNDAFVQSFEIRYDAGVSLGSVTVPATVRVPTTGSATYVVPLIPATDFAALAAAAGSGTLEMIVNVRAKGVFGSQSSFTTAWFQVPVQVCNYCLQSVCPVGSVFTASCPPAAPGATSPGQTAQVVCTAVAP